MRLHPHRAAALALTSVVLAGCSSAVVTETAPHANDTRCATAMLRTPDEIAGGKRRPTTTQGTTAYGDPALVVVSCGVDEPGPTSDKCLRVNSVDWIIKERRNPSGSPSHTWTATTYGTEPAIQVVLDADRVPSSDVLPALEPAALSLVKKRSCL